jgi:hypothetical protein
MMKIITIGLMFACYVSVKASEYAPTDTDEYPNLEKRVEQSESESTSGSQISEISEEYDDEEENIKKELNDIIDNNTIKDLIKQAKPAILVIYKQCKSYIKETTNNSPHGTEDDDTSEVPDDWIDRELRKSPIPAVVQALNEISSISKQIEEINLIKQRIYTVCYSIPLIVDMVVTSTSDLNREPFNNGVASLAFSYSQN